MQKPWLGSICLALAASIWGGMYVVSKYVLQYIPPFPLLFLRYGIGVIVLLFSLWITIRKTAKINSPRFPQLPLWKSAILLGWVGFIGYFVSVGAQFAGTKLSDAHSGALITSASPAFIFLFAGILLGERLTRRRAVSLILASLGVIVVIGWNVSGGHNFVGDIYLLVAAVTWALLSVYAKIASRYYSSLVVTTAALAFATVFTGPVAVSQWTADQWFALQRLPVLGGVLYLGVISTALAFFLWNKGMELMDAGPGSLFFFFQPVVGALFGWLLLGEQLTWNFFAGGLLIVFGVCMALLGSDSQEAVPNANIKEESVNV